jgi:hypothetical protein
MPVRVKIKNSSGQPWVDWYRVRDGEQIGWQAGKPEHYMPVPYFNPALDPFAPEFDGGPLYWTEGEKDTDAAVSLGLPAFTFGGTGGGAPEGCKKYIAGREVIITADNDSAGEEHARKKAKLAATVALNVKVVRFPDLPKGGDFSDWLETGGTIDNLQQLVQAAPDCPPDWQPETDTPPPEDVTVDDEIARWAKQAVSPDTEAVWYEPGNEAECREALDGVVGSHARTFMVGDALVILRIPKLDVADASWDGDLPATTPVHTADVIERAEQLHWMTPAGGKGAKRWNRSKPPRDFCGDYLIQRRREYGARPLKGISRVPFMRDDGTIDTCVGYSAETGIFYDDLPHLNVPEKPSKDEALAALKRFMYPYSLYLPEDGPAFQPLMLGASLTALERPFMGTAPMFALKGAQSGTGKGEIIRAIARLALNTAPPLMSWGHDDNEFKKRFDAMMLLSPAMFSIDNANGKLLSHDALEMLLTEGVLTVRVFGSSRTSPSGHGPRSSSTATTWRSPAT